MNPIKQIAKEANDLHVRVSKNDNREFIVVAKVGPRTFRELVALNDNDSYIQPFTLVSEQGLLDKFKIQSSYYAFDSEVSSHGTTPVIIDSMVSYKRSHIDVVFKTN